MGVSALVTSSMSLCKLKERVINSILIMEGFAAGGRGFLTITRGDCKGISQSNRLKGDHFVC